MSPPDQNLEEREKELSNRIQSLEDQLQRLERLERLSARIKPEEPEIPVTKSEPEEYPTGELSDVSEEVLNWVGRTSLLPRLATLCFMLVVALILRTLTDSGIVNKLPGSGIGMAYATGLMIAGWYFYSRKSPLAPVFSACGAVLMATIVVETHTHFDTLPLIPAYLTLIATGISMTVMSYRYDSVTPMSLGTLGMCLAGAAIDFPNPFFPYLALVLFVATILGYFAAQLKRCTWLCWVTMFLNLITLQVWGARLSAALHRQEPPAPELAASWFLPILAVFAATYFCVPLFGTIRDSAYQSTRFERGIPVFNVLCLFTIALLYVKAGGGPLLIFSGIGIICALGHLAIIFWLQPRGSESARIGTSYAFAGIALLALSLPPAFGSFALSLPIVSLTAVILAAKSRAWGSDGIRLTACIYQFYCCSALIVSLITPPPAAAMAPINLVPAGLLSLFILYLYRWCRKYPPAASSAFFSRFDTGDRVTSLLLLAGLICIFLTLRVAIFQFMYLIPKAQQQDAFSSSQTLMINGSAIALILFAYLRHNKEIRNVAFLVTLVGGVKVFLFDLLGTHGLPLVFSIFSFGLAAAVASLALSKWQKARDIEVKGQ